jgi:hypothetical protein
MQRICLAAVLAIAACGGSPRLSVSRQTTYFTGPLRPDGSVDYAATLNELYGAGVDPENNSAIPLMAALGDAVPEAVAKRMGRPQAPAPTERFLGGPGDWSKYIEWRRERGRPLAAGMDDKAAGRRLDTEVGATIRGPWAAANYPLVAGWLEDVKRPLEAVDQATMRPRHWIPITSPLSGTFIPSLITRRNVANALRSRAMLRLRENDPDGAARDLLTIARLASRQARGPTLIDHLIAVAISGIATERLPLVAAHPKLSRDALLRTLSEMRGLEPLPPAAEKIGNYERASVLETAVEVAVRGKTGDIDLRYLDPSLVDWDEVLETINRCYDAEISCQQAPSTEARRAACDERDRCLPEDTSKAAKDLVEGGASPTGIATAVFKTVVAIALPSLRRAQVSCNEANTLERLARSALVLRGYRNTNGRFPDRLESVSASELYGVSVTTGQHGYRFAFRTGRAGSYAYTAVPEDQGPAGCAHSASMGRGAW